MAWRVLVVLLISTCVSFTGCSDDGEDAAPTTVNEAAVRSEAFLLVQNDAAPIDLIEATEREVLTFGADDEEILLDATEYATGAGRSVGAADEGASLLISTEVGAVRYRDDDGDGDGTVELLDANENPTVVQEDVVLEGQEVAAIFKQTSAFNVSTQVELVIDELQSGRWQALLEAARSLAPLATDGESLMSALEAAVSDFDEELSTMLDLLELTDTTTSLSQGVIARPSLFQVLPTNSSFGTQFTYGTLFDADSRDGLRTFLVGVAQELRGFVSQEPIVGEFLPAILQDVDGYSINTDGSGGMVRYRLNWDAPVDLDIYVTDPSGATISYQNETTDRGELDFDNTTGGPASVENIVYFEPLAGTYSGYVNYFSSRSFGDPVTFELTAYVDGRIFDRIQQTFTVNDVDGNSDRIRLRFVR